MPTYNFICNKCEVKWEEVQSVKLQGKEHISKCPKCDEICNSIISGGTGFQFAGKHFTEVLTGFPDHTSRTNKIAEAEGEEMEKAHDEYVRQQQDNEKDK